jgi:hypothetical protein
MKLYDWRFSPPSSNDYKKLIVSHFKNYTDYEIIFSIEGIYIISLGQILLNRIKSNPKLNEVALHNIPASRAYTEYTGTYEWIDFLEEISDKTNDANIVLSSNEYVYIPQQDGNIKKIEIEKVIKIAAEHGNETSRTLEGYLKIIREIGFDIKFYNWTESLDIKLKIKKNNYENIERIYLLKQQKTKLVQYYGKLEGYDDDILLHTESNFFNLKAVDLDCLYNKLNELTEGEVLLSPI